ncbi:hypothetical protein ABT255_00470 [Streptomyces mirabilis]|uniref:hypothetical protein n=1 Tax=Streptomyces mirabilis TaxID=68239 RepID=UPI003331E845
MTWSTVLFAFTVGLLQSVATAPAGVSGAVFQFSRTRLSDIVHGLACAASLVNPP